MKSLPGVILLSALILSGSVSPACFGQSGWGQQRFDLFSGVSVHPEAVHGGNASLTFKINRRFSLVADFSAHQESLSGSFSTDILHGLFGGQMALGGFAGLKPFARITSGVTHREISLAPEGSPPAAGGGTGFVLGVGGGIDYPSAGLLNLRMIQVDYLTRPDNREGGDVRFSFGVVLSF